MLFERSPDRRGQRVEMAAADHPHSGEIGIVVDQVTCDEYDDLVVELAGGTRTRVYEPEADLQVPA